jgi:hypothetical protein
MDLDVPHFLDNASGRRSLADGRVVKEHREIGGQRHEQGGDVPKLFDRRVGGNGPCSASSAPVILLGHPIPTRDRMFWYATPTGRMR